MTLLTGDWRPLAILSWALKTRPIKLANLRHVGVIELPLARLKTIPVKTSPYINKVMYGIRLGDTLKSESLP